MALRLADKWVWDFWLVESGGLHHIFYLQAPKSIGDPELRHWHSSIGHAVSDDLIEWQIMPDALGPGAPGSFDDKSTWTGSIIEDDGRWHLFYTGTSTVDDGHRQRIGLASSDDLVSWERSGRGPVITHDPRWYETIEQSKWHDEAWRDPWVFRHDGMFHATITARVNNGHRLGRGVVAHARSHDLLDWEVLPPITEPDGFGQTEVSQVIRYENRWYLVFCSDTATQSTRRRTNGPGSGTYYLSADDPLGPFALKDAKPLSVDRPGSTYAGRLVDLGPQGLFFLTWEWVGHGHQFLGVISDPFPVRAGTSGELELVR